MRKETTVLQISPRRLLSLLLLQIIAALAIQQVNCKRSYSPSDPSSKGKWLQIGGVPYIKEYLMQSMCRNSRYVLMLPGPKKKISARGKYKSLYSVLKFESDPSERKGYVRIQGRVTGKYMCFSKRARLISRSNGDVPQCWFKEEMAQGRFIRLRSSEHPDWYVGFSRRGRRLRGSKYKLKLRRHRNCFMFKKSEWHYREPRPGHSRGPFRDADAAKLLKDERESSNR